MDKSKKVFLLLGLGSGIIIANILNYVYPKVLYEDLPDELIISKAKELGMVSLSESLVLNEKSKEKETKNNIMEESKEDTIEENFLSSIELIVNKGDSLTVVAEKLKKLELINDEEEFRDYVISKGKQSKINYGSFIFHGNDSYEEILKKLVEK